MTKSHRRANFVRPILGVAVATLVISTTGCLTNPAPPPKPDIHYLQEAASVHIAPLSVARWEDYVQRLQPQFPMTSASALALALPHTFSSQEAFSSAFSAGFQAGPAFTTSTSTSQGQSQAASAAQLLTNSNGTGATNGSTTSTSASGTTAAASAANTASTTVTTTVGSGSNASSTQTTTTQQTPATLPSNGLSPLAMPNAAALTSPSGTLQLDPMLAGTAAAAILQEYALLNGYIQDAALRYGKVPYVARVQVSLSPLAHHLPYDAYVDIGVFSTCNGNDPKPVVLVPLLVTDDVETGQAANALSAAQQLGLSLGATTGGIAFQAAVADLKNQFKSILTNDYNSLYMVTRGIDNTLQVRLGASRNSDEAQYSMLTQTHDVSFVMLVDKGQSPDAGACAKPSGPPKIYVNTYTRLRDARTGVELPANSGATRKHAVALLERIVEDDACVTGMMGSDDKSLLDSLVSYVQLNDIQGFTKTLDSVLDRARRCKKDSNRAWPAPPPAVAASASATEDKPRSLDGKVASVWTAFASVVNMSEFAGTFMDLPATGRGVSGDATDSSGQELVLLNDDCKTATTAQVASLGRLTPSQIKAQIKLKGSGDKAGVLIAASSISQSAVGQPYVLVFPTLAPLGTVTRLESAPLLASACPDDHADKSDDNKVATAPAKKGKIKKVVEPVKPAPSPLLEASLTLTEQADTRWNEGKEVLPTMTRTYGTLLLQGKAKAEDHSATLTSSGAIVLAGSGTTSGTARVKVKLASSLDDAVLSFNGAVLAGIPANATAAEKPPQPSATLIVSSGFIDIPLQSLAVGQTVTISVTGRKGGEVVSDGGSNLTVPVVAAVAAADPTKK